MSFGREIHGIVCLSLCTDSFRRGVIDERGEFLGRSDLPETLAFPQDGTCQGPRWLQTRTRRHARGFEASATEPRVPEPGRDSRGNCGGVHHRAGRPCEHGPRIARGIECDDARAIRAEETEDDEEWVGRLAEGGKASHGRPDEPKPG
jgi:hypothetical protein